jgi:hypothetical protein
MVNKRRRFLCLGLLMVTLLFASQNLSATFECGYTVYGPACWWNNDPGWCDEYYGYCVNACASINMGISQWFCTFGETWGHSTGYCICG